MHSIQKITSTETYPVRHIVLRAGKPIESCQFDGDELGSTHHFGYYLNHQINHQDHQSVDIQLIFLLVLLYNILIILQQVQ